MNYFEQLQVSGMQPSLLMNRIGLSEKTMDAIFSRISVLPSGCWEWMGSRFPNGYGRIKIRAISPNGLLVHRVCFEMVNGKIGENLQLHHKVEEGCIGPACCNPAHLKDLTSREHLIEYSPTNQAYINSRRTACAAGHEYTKFSVYISPVDGSRQCKVCRAAAARDYRERQRNGAPKRKGGPKPKTHCLNGHEMAGENLQYVTRKGKVNRVCRICHIARSKASYAKVKAGKD